MSITQEPFFKLSSIPAFPVVTNSTSFVFGKFVIKIFACFGKSLTEETNIPPRFSIDLIIFCFLAKKYTWTLFSNRL